MNFGELINSCILFVLTMMVIIRFKRSYRIDINARLKTISMDLNSYYQEIVIRLFPNAQIIIDRFHIVAMLTRAFNQYRTQVMKRFEKTSRNYRL